MERKRANTKRFGAGFTLVELLVVVAIIGVLAAVAAPVYQTYQLNAKRTEAVANLSGLALAQKAFFAEYGAYVGVVAAEPGWSLGNTPPGPEPRDVTPLRNAFAVLGWAPDGDVRFDYDSAGSATFNNQDAGGVCACGPACFTAAAYGDLDGDGALSVVAYFEPNGAGAFCPTTLAGGQLAPLDSNGNSIFSEVVRIPVGVVDDY